MAAGTDSDLKPANPESAESIRERLRQAVDEAGGPKHVASRSGIPLGTLNKYLSDTKIPADRLPALADGCDVRAIWLLTGEEPMKRGGSASISAGAEIRARGRKSAEGEYVYIPRFDVTASAGPGRWPDREIVLDHMAFRRDWVRRALGTDPSHLVLITATGDSMEPTIRSGDLLLIDTSVDRLRDDAIYVIVRGGQLVVKRLQRLFAGAVVVHSDNPAYRDEQLDDGDLQQLKIAGRVRWIARVA